MCPLGLGNPNAECRFHRASDNMTPDGKCPVHKLDLVKTTAPDDKITITVMGEDELDTHEIPEGKDKMRKLTAQEKQEYRDKIRADIIKYKLLED